MTKAESVKLATEGYDLDRRIKEIEPRLKEIKEIFAGAANGEAAEFLGRNCSVKVSFSPPNPSLPEGKEAEVKELCGPSFKNLFPRKPAPKFRDVVKTLLPTGVAERLFGICSEGELVARVSFKDAK